MGAPRVTGMLENCGDRAVTEAVIDLGHRLGLRVIAECVETEQLLDALAALGCDRGQGYVIARPMPPAELERWLRARPARPRGGTPVDAARQLGGTALSVDEARRRRAEVLSSVGSRARPA